jgi:outer membrane protein OmpA-like peptidoglycan-associated protein
LFFSNGSSELDPKGAKYLDRLGQLFRGHQGAITVEGHTDAVGTDEYNQSLSEHRAEAVRDYLVQQGIAANSVDARGFGKTQPIATNETAEGRQQNRRVELVLSGDAIGNATASAGGAQQ